LAAAVRVLRVWQLQALVDLRLRGAGHQLVEEATDLSHVARRLRQAYLTGVEFFEHDHRDIDVVLVETEDRRRIVHQHVGVEHEDASLLTAARSCAPALGLGKFASGHDVRAPSLLRALRPRGRGLSPCATPAAARRRRRSGTCFARRTCTCDRTCSSLSTRRTTRTPSCLRPTAARTGIPSCP